MTPWTSLLEHSLTSTIKEVPAELESNCAHAAILQFQADRATECYIQPPSAVSSCVSAKIYPEKNTSLSSLYHSLVGKVSQLPVI